MNNFTDQEIELLYKYKPIIRYSKWYEICDSDNIYCQYKNDGSKTYNDYSKEVNILFLQAEKHNSIIVIACKKAIKECIFKEEMDEIIAEGDQPKVEL